MNDRMPLRRRSPAALRGRNATWMALWLCFLVIACGPARAQTLVKLVDLIPSSMSAEKHNDSEPSLAIDPTNPQALVASALTPAPPEDMGCLSSPNRAPIFVSTDGGSTWVLRCIVPSDPSQTTADISIRHGGASGRLYASILRPPSVDDFFTQEILSTGDLSTTLGMERLGDGRWGADQPIVHTTRITGWANLGMDRLFVASNSLSNQKTLDGTGTGRTATLDIFLDPLDEPTSPVTTSLETRQIAPQFNLGVRVAAHTDGTVYTLFYRVDTLQGMSFSGDVVVLRDDAWGTHDFADLNDGLGAEVASDVIVPYIPEQGHPEFGYQRLAGSSVAIAVDPNSSDRVFIVWADASGPNATNALHVCRSEDRGQTWEQVRGPVGRATNPALAINVHGTVGFLYQKITGTYYTDLNDTQRWETHFERTTNDFETLPLDLLLADTRAEDGYHLYPLRDPFLGDYLDLVTLGKDFHGVFSASNRPVAARFPACIAFQRSADWSRGRLTSATGDSVPVSIDPFYFHFQELPPPADSYVSDWVDGPGAHDDGTEPSTHADFFTTSDLWNRWTDAPGEFDNDDRPQCRPARRDGDNFAFVRLRRKAPGTPAPVTVRVLVANFGTGNNFVAAGTEPDPLVTFAPEAVEKTLASGYRWRVPEAASTHLCMVVEIASPSDPYIGQSLFGTAPGWPERNQLMLNDNNRAQRNLLVEPVSGADSVFFYALVHNAALTARDITLHSWAPADSGLRPTVQAVGGPGHGLGKGMGLVLDDMDPGENRWVRINMPATGAPGSRHEVLFAEMVGEAAVNGFGFVTRVASLGEVARANLELQRDLLRRVTSAWPLDAPLAAMESKITELLSAEPLSVPSYVEFVESSREATHIAIERLLQAAALGDPFGLRAMRERLAAVPKDHVPRLVSAHAGLLQSVDAFLTMIEKHDGDSADVLQTVGMQRSLCRRLGAASQIGPAARLAREAEEFIRLWNEGRVGVRDYPTWMQEHLADLDTLAAAFPAGRPQLEQDVRTIRDRLDSPPKLQSAHRRLLLHLRPLAE